VLETNGEDQKLLYVYEDCFCTPGTTMPVGEKKLTLHAYLMSVVVAVKVSEDWCTEDEFVVLRLPSYTYL